MVDEGNYIDLGLTYNAVCTAFDRGLKRRGLDEPSGSVVNDISQLTK